MLDIITQMADYICEHTSNRIYGPFISSVPFTTLDNLLLGQLFTVMRKRKIEDFKKEFTRAKELFDRGIDLETLRAVHNLGE